MTEDTVSCDKSFLFHIYLYQKSLLREEEVVERRNNLGLERPNERSEDCRLTLRENELQTEMR